ncbi:cell division protein [Aureimonas ureilytica]|uniref:DNA translocase FtsK n=1 Tax=Aureimonas ureilytica TaxID=401562 RepID=A0A175RJV8_9HYPH|nr:DNA translocase FtsK [Aureimonas ureilytica]KTR03681.1 cell division protein [Aureimonas ureilytica]
MAMASIEAREEGAGRLGRPAQVVLGLALVAASIWLALSFASWTVDDPSLSYSNDHAVQNLAGRSGAMVADLGMQLFGLAAVLLPVLLTARGVLLLLGRRVGRSGARAWWALAGMALASAALGSLPSPASWPLPIGLGGVVGDLVLKIPALATGTYPQGSLGIVLAVVFALPAVWCVLNGAGLVARLSDEYEAEMHPRGHGAARGRHDDEREGAMQLLAGAAGHWLYSARSALGRKIGDIAEARRLRDDPFAHRDWDRDAPLMPPAPEARLREALRAAEEAEAGRAPASRGPRIVQPPRFDEAVEFEPDETEMGFVPEPAARPAPAAQPRAAAPARAQAPAPAPAARAPAPTVAAPEMPARRTVDTSKATVRHGRSDWNGSYKMAQREAALLAAAEAARAAELGLPAPDTEGDYDPAQDYHESAHDEAHHEPRFETERYEEDEFEDAPFELETHAHLGDESRPTLEERIAAEEEDEDRFHDEPYGVEAEMRREPEPEEQGGWRGFIANNIVAFPGLKRAQRPEPEPARPAPVAPRPAPQAGVAARGAMAADPRPVRVQMQPSMDMHAHQSSRARLAEFGHPDLNEEFILPPIELLAPPKPRNRDNSLTPEILQENARLLEGVLDDFGVKGEIIEVRPGPVVTLYELEPAPGIKSSRVIGLADDIARSMSAIAARVAVIPGKNAIGIELPNQRRETVYFREMIGSDTFAGSKAKLPLALGKTIGGEAVIADLAKMPHLLVAGTTGSGKSVSINTMILSLLYRMSPAECRMIMIDPKMLELSIYDGIPHLLAPVVTDPKKAVVALKWTVREMEDRYRKMSKVGVRNIDGFNARVASAIERGESISRTVQTGFDRETGEPIFESEEFDLQPLPYIVVIIDEMADLMMVAGKDIEGTVQRLAQMARAAGIHVIMATQRPSVDVITGTIKANFPTRISFQVTSKIDSRTILQEQGAEQLLGMGDMLFMAGGGRIQRVHGPFVGDDEVEEIVKHLKTQGVPEYLDAILEDEDEEAPAAAAGGSTAGMEESADLYDQAVAIVLRDGKASTSYVQRRLQIGYNRAASIIERMEREGIVGPANHAGKREILVPTDNA